MQRVHRELRLRAGLGQLLSSPLLPVRSLLLELPLPNRRGDRRLSRGRPSPMKRPRDKRPGAVSFDSLSIMPEQSTRRFPPPWSVVEQIPGGYKVLDANGPSLAYVYGRETKADADMAHVLTMDEARRIASNIAKLPNYLGANPDPD
jgi:hypothetical protein